VTVRLPQLSLRIYKILPTALIGTAFVGLNDHRQSTSAIDHILASSGDTDGAYISLGMA
jgi:hypothetical protein